MTPQEYRQELWRSDYGSAVSLDYVPGVDTGDKFGDSLGMAEKHTVTAFAALQPIYIFPVDAGISLTVAAAAATAVEVTIIGLDVNRDEQIEVVTTNGTTPVAVPGTWRAVNRAYVSGAVAATAAITIKDADSANIHGYIRVEDQQTSQVQYMVPAGKVLELLGFYITLSRATGSDVNCPFKLKIRKPGGVFRTIPTLGLQKSGSSTLTRTAPRHKVYPPGSQITIEATPVASSDVSASYIFDLIDTALLSSEFLASIA